MFNSHSYLLYKIRNNYKHKTQTFQRSFQRKIAYVLMAIFYQNRSWVLFLSVFDFFGEYQMHGQQSMTQNTAND